mgnify:CR=1 FL=1
MSNLFDEIDINQYFPAALDWASNILLAILILLLGLWFAGKVNKLIVGASKKNKHLDDTLFRFLGSVARYLIIAFVVIAVLNRFGVQTASIVALLGAAGLAVGLALQGAMSNLAAGVMLLIFRPYKVNDFIDAAGRFGKVTEIDMFTTVLQTFDNQQVIVPNSQIWGDQIVNHSHYDVRGVDMHFGVAYDESTDEARAVIQSVLANHPYVLKTTAPFVEFERSEERRVGKQCRSG